MLSHEFVPYESGEHAVAEQYMFALHQMGRAALKENRPEDALELFRRAQNLPENLGSGIWNIALLVPHQYYEALCLEKLGQIEQAQKLYDHILSLTVDYFTDMCLPALPYYQALCYNKRDNRFGAMAVLDQAEQKYRQNICKEDPGFFSTTPFFISYVDTPSRMRRAHYSYLLSLVYSAMGNKAEAAHYRKESEHADPYPLRYYADDAEGSIVECQLN